MAVGEERGTTPARGRLASLVAGVAVAFGLGVAVLCGSAVAGAESAETDSSAPASDSSAESSATPVDRFNDEKTGLARPGSPSGTDRDVGDENVRDGDDTSDSQPADDPDDDIASDELDAHDASELGPGDADAPGSEPASESSKGTGLADVEGAVEPAAEVMPVTRHSSRRSPPPAPPVLPSRSEAPEDISAIAQAPLATPSFAVSFSGIQLVQVGSASATSTGLGSWAIAWGENASASATGGMFNNAWAIGADSVAAVNFAPSGGSASGSFNIAVALGNGVAGVNSALTGSGATATASGCWNSAWSLHGGSALVNEARADGDGAVATTTGSFNAAASWQGSALVNDVLAETVSGNAIGDADGSFNRAWARGSFADAEVNHIFVSATGGGTATASAAGNSNTAKAVGNSSGTVNYLDTEAIAGKSTALASGSHNRARINTAVGGVATVNGAVVEDGASAMIDGSGNVATGERDGSAYVNIVDAFDAGSAGVAEGNHNVARFTGSGNIVSINASFGGAFVGGGNHNLARVWGTNSTATTSGGDHDAAIAIGDHAKATAEGSCDFVVAVGSGATGLFNGGRPPRTPGGPPLALIRHTDG